METKKKEKKIAKIVTLIMASMFLGVLVLVFKSFAGSDGMEEREMKLAQKELKKKYGKEFIIRDVYSRSPDTFYVHCSPAFNKKLVFRAEIYRDGRGVYQDEYLQGIVAREMEKEIEAELKKYYDSIFVQVYPSGVGKRKELEQVVDGIKDITMEEYVRSFEPSMCRVDIGIDAKEGNDHLEEEYAFYESMQEKIGSQKMVPMYVIYYQMDAELQEWCDNYFTRYSEAPGIYTGKRSKCNKMEFDCAVEGISVTYDEFKTMREELGKDE